MILRTVPPEHTATIDVPAAAIDWPTFVAPIAVGVILWLVAEAVRWAIAKPRKRKARRMRIVGSVSQARMVLHRGIRDGVFSSAVRAERHSAAVPDDLRALQARYDDLTVEALMLFVPGEEEVARWVEAEFYTGFASVYAATSDLDRGDTWGLPFEADGFSYVLPREYKLLLWARGKNRYSPIYGWSGKPGDTTQHKYVIPNSDVNMSMLRAPITGWKSMPDAWLKNRYPAGGDVDSASEPDVTRLHRILRWPPTKG